MTFGLMLFFHIKVRIVTLMILDKNVTFTEVFITDIYALVTARQRSEIEVMEADCKQKSHG